MNQTVRKLKGKTVKVTILFSRNGVLEARTPLAFHRTNIGAEAPYVSRTAAQGPGKTGLRAKEPRKDLTPARNPRPSQGVARRQQDGQGAAPITKVRGSQRSQWMLRKTPGGSHAPKLSSKGLVAGAWAGGRRVRAARGRGGQQVGTTAPDSARGLLTKSRAPSRSGLNAAT
jgi:hypothetical protein